jgi:acyl-[acyl-carrier-protein] desaturase
MTPERRAIMWGLEPLVASLLHYLKPVEECWQPSDLLPQFGGEGWREEVEELRTEAAALTDEMLVVLVGNVVTEEGLPLYLAALNRFDGLIDGTGVETHGWARWSRSWTAEEKRHGDVTRTYLYLSGRVDHQIFERTVQHFLQGGFDTRANGDPYRGLAYASFQEHATKTSWNQLGKLAGSVGASRLHRICGLVAADEARHERVYASVLREVVKVDPAGVLESLHDTFGHSIVMPARTMTDGHDRRLFSNFAEVGQRIGVYTLKDYADNLHQLVALLSLETLTGIPAAAAEFRDAICALPARYDALAEERAAHPGRPHPFRWIFGRKA